MVGSLILSLTSLRAVEYLLFWFTFSSLNQIPSPDIKTAFAVLNALSSLNLVFFITDKGVWGLPLSPEHTAKRHSHTPPKDHSDRTFQATHCVSSLPY